MSIFDDIVEAVEDAIEWVEEKADDVADWVVETATGEGVETAENGGQKQERDFSDLQEWAIENNPQALSIAWDWQEIIANAAGDQAEALKDGSALTDAWDWQEIIANAAGDQAEALKDGSAQTEAWDWDAIIQAGATNAAAAINATVPTSQASDWDPMPIPQSVGPAVSPGSNAGPALGLTDLVDTSPLGDGSGAADRDFEAAKVADPAGAATRTLGVADLLDPSPSATDADALNQAVPKAQASDWDPAASTQTATDTPADMAGGANAAQPIAAVPMTVEVMIQTLVTSGDVIA